MKKIISIWLAALMLAAQPIQAAVCVGFGQSAAEDFCEGTESFCTSWETGSDEINTGATGNEDVWASESGTVTKTSYNYEGNSGVSMSAAINYLEWSHGAAQNAVTIEFVFEIDTEAMNTSTFGQIAKIRTASADIYLVEIGDDATQTNDSNIELRVRSYLSSSLVAVGSAVSITLDTRYRFVGTYDTTNNIASWTLYNESGGTVGSGSDTLTANNTALTYRLGPQAYNFSPKIGAFKVTQ